MNTIGNDTLGTNGAASQSLRYDDPENQSAFINLDDIPQKQKLDVGRIVRRLFMAGTAGTAMMTAGVLSYPSMDFWRPGSVAHYWVHRRRRRRPISVAEARSIALRAMEETERLLHQERMAEAAFLAQLFDDEEFISG